MERLTEDLLIAYVDGQLTTDDAARVDAALQDDPAARDAVNRLKMLSGGIVQSILPVEVPDFTRQVLERARQTPSPRRPAGLLAVGAALFVSGTFVIATEMLPVENGLVARGGVAGGFDRLLGVEVFAHTNRHPWNRRRLSEGSSAEADREGFSFVIYNRSGRKTWLMLFCVDSESQVHWFYPDVALSIEESIAIRREPQVLPLPEGVALDAAKSGSFTFIALFSEAPLMASKVEAAIQRNELELLAGSIQRLKISLD